LIEVIMSAQAGANPGGSASVFLDPFFSVDPAFPNADQFSILTSPGIGNSPTAVPLLPLFASGLAGLGWLARRKKRMAGLA
jgi:hypothetical protein